MEKQQEKKTLIGVLASHDSPEKNNALARLFDILFIDNALLLEQYHFLFTAGTYERVVLGTGNVSGMAIKPINKHTKKFLIHHSTCLPSRRDGGVTILAFSVVQRDCSILWPFLTPVTAHWLNPENLALMRLSDQWHVKRLMNTGSVTEWFKQEADTDKTRNLHEIPLNLVFPGTGYTVSPTHSENGHRIDRPNDTSAPKTIEEMTIAIIAHDHMKGRMIDFALDYERELGRFKKILASGTTGRDVGDAASSLQSKIYRYHSGPKGGDIEIASEILFGRCHVVVFFIDPLNPHPHIEDIRVVFGACMIQDKVRMLTNEMQAREWMERVVKRGNIHGAKVKPLAAYRRRLRRRGIR